MTNIEQSNEKRQRSQAITQTEWEQYMAEKILRLISAQIMYGLPLYGCCIVGIELSAQRGH